jgi:hypothetical protein
MRFTKKPVEIEAWPVSQIVEQMKHHEDGLPAPVRTEWKAGRVQRIIDGLIIHTLEGAMNADPDDWLIRGIQGELYPCKPDIFEATYEWWADPKQLPGAASREAAGDLIVAAARAVLNGQDVQWCEVHQHTALVPNATFCIKSDWLVERG